MENVYSFELLTVERERKHVSVLYLILAFPRCLMRECTRQLFWMYTECKLTVEYLTF